MFLICCMPWERKPQGSADIGGFSATDTSRPTLMSLFLCFFLIGCQSFGGGISAWIRREVVDKRGWLDSERFLSTLAICQITPGPNPMNMAVFIGNTLRGGVGSLVALAGLMLVPVILVLGLGAIYFQTKTLPIFEIAIGGLGAAAIGMNASNGIRLARKSIKRPHQIILLAIVVILIGVVRLPLVPVLAVVVPLSIATERWVGR